MADDFRELSYDPETGIETSMQIVDGLYVIRHRIPKNFIDAVQEEAKERRKNHEWAKALKNPYVPVATVPLMIHDEWVAASGFDAKVGLYDRKYYNQKFLNNTDFENFRLTPGKV